MHRLGNGFVVALLLGALGILLLQPLTARPAERTAAARAARPGREPIRVSLFGDSLAYQSRAPFLEATAPLGVRLATVSTRPGAALCDDRDAIVRDLASERPDLLLLEYSGNSFTPCMTDARGAQLAIGSRAWRDRYRADLDRIATMAARLGTQVVWATAPPVEKLGAPPDYPAHIAAIAREIADQVPQVRVADTGAAVAADDDYARTLPCRAEEAGLCRDDRIAVRAPDGLHFDCIGTVDFMGGCIGYSAGARRYGAALAATVTFALASPTRDISG